MNHVAVLVAEWFSVREMFVFQTVSRKEELEQYALESFEADNWAWLRAEWDDEQFGYGLDHRLTPWMFG